MIFGITEAGDASINYEWIEKLSEVDGCILITKNLTDKFIKTVLSFKDKKIIIHASCTGYGGTVVEPHCPNYEETLTRIRALLDNGWDASRIVLRIDPIIPTKKGIMLFETIVKKAQERIPEVTRIRVSVLDMYKHVQKRFNEKGLPCLYHNNFSASKDEFEALDSAIESLKETYPMIHIESCAETNLPHSEAIGCVSEKDFTILGLKLDSTEKKGQRKHCLCVCAKKELLTYQWNKTGYNHCYGCLYCYWKTELDK